MNLRPATSTCDIYKLIFSNILTLCHDFDAFAIPRNSYFSYKFSVRSCNIYFNAQKMYQSVVI